MVIRAQQVRRGWATHGRAGLGEALFGIVGPAVHGRDERLAPQASAPSAGPEVSWPEGLDAVAPVGHGSDGPALPEPAAILAAKCGHKKGARLVEQVYTLDQVKDIRRLRQLLQAT